MENSSLTRYFWPFIKRYMKSFIFIALLWAINSTYTIITPYFLKIFINEITNCQVVDLIFNNLKIPLILFASFLTLRYLSISVVVRVMAKVFAHFRADIRLSLFNHLMDHSSNFFAQNFSGTITNHLVSMPKNSHKIFDTILKDFIPTIFELILGIFFLFQAHYIFALIFLGWLFLHLAIIISTNNNINLRYTKYAEKLAHLNGKMGDVITNIHNVRLFSGKNFEKSHLQAHQKEEIEEYRKSVIFAERIKGFTSLINSFFMPLSMTICLVLFWQKGWVTVGDFGLILPLTNRLLSHGWEIGVKCIEVAEDVGSCKEALRIIQQPHEIADEQNSPSLHVAIGKIEIKNLYFSYGEDAIFEDLNLKISGGEKVGIVGFSGSGKSTFVNLLLRNFNVEKGAILIDDQNIANVSQHSLHEQIAVVPQDILLFHRSVMENIRYGNLEASDEAVIEAAKKAHAHEFIIELPEQYQTIAGERGVKLSGGQKQRIAIARAMLKDSHIFIFDEATSAVDPVTETKIQESLLYLTGKTVILVTHRLPILAYMDRIIVFKDGKIVEEGPHSDLIKGNSYFASLWQAQMKENVASNTITPFQWRR